MITKEISRLVHNCYTEIEQGKAMIEELQKNINEKGELELKDSWGTSSFVQLHIPNKGGSYSVKRVPMEVTLNVITSHIDAQERELKRLKEICRIQLA